MLKGIDISVYQGVMDFDAVKKDFDFCITRTSYGTAAIDKFFNPNLQAMRSRGILRGYYHYAYPTYNSPENEAQYFYNALGELQNGELAVLDFEEQFSAPVTWCLKFLQKFEQLSGYKPLLYINLDTVRAYDWTPVIQNNNGLWLAQWDFNPNSTPPATPWPVIAMRQYTDKLNYQGKTIDGDVFYGDINTYIAYGFKGDSDMTNGALPANYADIIKKASNWDNVCSAQGLGDPVQASPDTLNASIAGLKSRITQLGNDVATAQGQLQTANDTISTLNQQIAHNQQSNDLLTQQVKDKQQQITELTTAKQQADSQLILANQQIESLKRGQAQGTITITFADLIKLLLQQKITISNK
jgi:lysozyme